MARRWRRGGAGPRARRGRRLPAGTRHDHVAPRHLPGRGRVPGTRRSRRSSASCSRPQASRSCCWKTPVGSRPGDARRLAVHRGAEPRSRSGLRHRQPGPRQLRKPFMEITTPFLRVRKPRAAACSCGIPVHATFGVVVTSAVQIAGVPLVFGYRHPGGGGQMATSHTVRALALLAGRSAFVASVAGCCLGVARPARGPEHPGHAHRDADRQAGPLLSAAGRASSHRRPGRRVPVLDRDRHGARASAALGSLSSKGSLPWIREQRRATVPPHASPRRDHHRHRRRGREVTSR
jgi:hypothetical protein